MNIANSLHFLFYALIKARYAADLARNGKWKEAQSLYR